MPLNPYESPRDIGVASNSLRGGNDIWVNLRKGIAGGGIAFGGMMGLLGQIITFVPGAEANWLGTGALLLLLGLLWPGWRVRAVAAVLFLWLATLAWNGHQRGEHYREWLRQRGASAAEVAERWR